MHNRTLFNLSIVFLLSCSFFGVECRQSSEPPIDQGKDPRTYTWRRDTLGDGTYQILMRSVWGSSPQDVYVVGHSSALFTGKIWHYDGTTWTDLTTKYIEAFPNQQIFYFAPADVYGFGKNDVWIVGYRDTSSSSQGVRQGFVMHYDGMKWQGTSMPEFLNMFAVGGNSSRDLWAGGISGRFYHFDGTNWSTVLIPDTIWIEQFAGSAGGKLYAGGFRHNNTTALDYDFVLEWNGTDWKVTEWVMEFNPGTTFRVPLRVISGDLYSYSGGAVLRRVAEGVWTVMLRDPNTAFYNISGSSSTMIFAVGGPRGEVIYHYNGFDWYRYPLFANPNIQYVSVWTGDNEVFVVGQEIRSQSGGFSLNYVLHGK
jgi:hypothetical protein